jgi:hypothetical protein
MPERDAPVSGQPRSRRIGTAVRETVPHVLDERRVDRCGVQDADDPAHLDHPRHLEIAA